MKNALASRNPHWSIPLSLLAGAGIAGVVVSLSLNHEHEAQLLPGITYEMEYPTPTEPMALVVTSVQRDSAADSADIVTGDIIDQVDGQKISSIRDVANAVARKSGHPISVRLRRAGTWLDKNLPATDSGGKTI